jgi:hypothetical protein
MYGPLRRDCKSGASTNNNNENFNFDNQPATDRLPGESSSWKLEHADFRLQMPCVERNNSDPRHGRTRQRCRKIVDWKLFRRLSPTRHHTPHTPTTHRPNPHHPQSPHHHSTSHVAFTRLHWLRSPGTAPTSADLWCFVDLQTSSQRLMYMMHVVWTAKSRPKWMDWCCDSCAWWMKCRCE